MSRKSFAGLLAVLVCAMSMALIVVAPASAHERRQVGDIWMIVGWKGEPALLSEPNALDLRVFHLKPGSDPAKQTAADRLPIEGLATTLKAEVTAVGSVEKMPLTISARFGDPGAYDGLTIPTKAGDYTFRVFGTVEGKAVNESFTSGPGTFGTVQDTAALQYPVKLTAAPDLVKRLDTIDAKLAELAKAGGSGSAPAVASTSTKSDDSNTATILAVVALIVAVAGAGAGGFALARKK